ncbi:mechanosensitive ion channel family protein [Woodsholea maritima]|uniref:mechanosensitive ion channel family protein n=1 Tax=Woodsholea maritima TaxID=240237 RepID=UPI00037CA127|nr:mechanosensitive ion channel domain-containing protein [Woodsholea maritima]
MTTPTDPNAGSALDELIPLDTLEEQALSLAHQIFEAMFTVNNAVQLCLIFGALIPAVVFGPKLRTFIYNRTNMVNQTGVIRRLASAGFALATPVALLAFLAGIRVVMGSLDQAHHFLDAAISLMTAWLIIRAVTLVIRSKFWSNVAFYIAWPVAALDVFGLLDDVIFQLQTLAIPLGQTPDGEAVDLSLFDVLRTIIYFGVLFWAASFAGRAIDRQLEHTEELSPAFRAMISKVLGVLLPVVALLIALQMTGFNLATLAIFSGAVGIGVGLGLQKTVANFAAGFTLLADKSIKPGDTIEVGGVFGWVTEMKSRYVAVRTRDGTEMLIPNEQFIAEGVTNWSHSDKQVRLHAPFGVAYNTRDLRAVQAIAIEAALSVKRVYKDKTPVCNLMGFGDSSVDFDLRFWITDPEAGQANVRSDVYLAIWDGLHEAGIEIPFPQMDIYVKALPRNGAEIVAPPSE